MGPYDWQWGPGAVGMPPNYGGGFPGPTPGSFAGNAPPVPASPLSPYRTSPGFAPAQGIENATNSLVPLGGSAGGPYGSGIQWGNFMNPLFLGGLGMLASSFGGPVGSSPSPVQGYMMGAGLGRQFQLDKERRAQQEKENEMQEAAAAQERVERERREAARQTLPPEARVAYDLTGKLPPATKPTTLQQNLQAAGVDLDTPEGRSTMLEIIRKPGTTINVGGREVDKLQAVRDWQKEKIAEYQKDVDDAAKAYKENPSPETKYRFDQANTALSQMKSYVNNFGNEAAESSKKKYKERDPVISGFIDPVFEKFFGRDESEAVAPEAEIDDLVNQYGG